MTWETEIAEIAKRKELAKGRGGPEGVARQRRRGKLLVNERLDGLLDSGSLNEFMSLVGSPEHDDSGELVGFTPKGSIEGFGKVNGRKIVVSAGDFTVRGGSGGGDGASSGLGSEKHSNQRALEWRVPYVRMLDSGGRLGARVRDAGPYVSAGREYVVDVRHGSDASGAGGLGGDGIGRRVAGGQCLHGPLHAHGEGDFAAFSGWSAGGQGGAGL